ncbi:DUF1793-domain-containing protein [Auricularia subglabra TFB-10046 SS5]|nr:DUF1793-domain-containing protein [Auricularia subglabra TFB-10046 SS5]
MRAASRPLSSCAAQLARAALLAWLFHAPCTSGAPNWKALPFNPPAIPLVVSSPYTSAWLQNGNGTALYDDWSRFWTGSTLGWAGLVQVDGKPYRTMGVPGDVSKCRQLSVKFTATSSVFTMRCGPVDFTYKFLSPINPDDLTRFSLPFSYMMITAAPHDGKAHTVRVYTDISAEHASTDFSAVVNWRSSKQDDKLLTHQIQITNQVPFNEKNGQILHGSFYYSTFVREGLLYRTGDAGVQRLEFIKTGKLTELLDENFRKVADRWPSVAFSVDLGKVQFASDTIVFGIGHARDTVAQLATGEGEIQERAPYYLTRFASILDALEFFMEDYQNATRTAELVDAQVLADCSEISDSYAGLVALSMRQALAPTELTVGKKSDGSLDENDVLLLLRGSTDGHVMNGIDTIYSMWPLIIYVNPTLGKYLLEPTLRYHAAGLSNQPFVTSDIGSEYPKGIGHAADDSSVYEMPIDATASMLILALSHAQKTNDQSLLKTYFNQLDQWAKYLVDNTLTPSAQNTTDRMSPSVAKQTNLALKGIIAIRAMGEIAKLLGQTDVAEKYSATAANYIQQWKTLGMSKDGRHLTFDYDHDESWGSSYNLYADSLLGLGLVPSDVYNAQEAWYKGRTNRFGIGIQAEYAWTLSVWEIWVATVVNDNDFVKLMVNNIVDFYSFGSSKIPMPDWYETVHGEVHDYRARPEVGGHLSLLSLQSRRLRLPDNDLDTGSSPLNPGNAAQSRTHSLPSPRTLFFVCAILYLPFRIFL